MDPQPPQYISLEPDHYYANYQQPFQPVYQQLQPIQPAQLDPLIHPHVHVSAIPIHHHESYPIMEPLPPQPMPTVQDQPVPNQSVIQSTSNISSTRTNSSHNNQQSHSTFKWLEANFQFRCHVSISRSTIYELYQKFCSQNNFVPVCKATFGKIIRIKFPKVKSKRLGARGQSKYHYYNITFKDERKRCSMILTSPATEETNSSQTNHFKQDPNKYPIDSYLTASIPPDPYIHIDAWFGQETPNSTLTELGPWNSNRSDVESTTLTSTQKVQTKPTSYVGHSNSRLTIFSNRHSAVDSYSHFNLNENDYHAIIQSMLSYMRIPGDQQPLNNDKFVFINLYKIHCQCLIDSALSGNYAQMRHYIMHFWQQLPRHVTIYVSAMHSLDSHMYSLLEDIYLSNIDSQMDNLKRLNTIAYLIPIWLRKTFEYVPFDGEWWNLVHHYHDKTNGHADDQNAAKRMMNISEIKVDEAEKWSYRIKFKVDLVVMIKKIDISNLSKVLSYLIEIFDKIYVIQTKATSVSYYDLDSSLFHQLVPHEFYINLHRADHHLLHQTQSFLWNTLLKQFHLLLIRLNSLIEKREESLKNEEATSNKLTITGQTLIDELDQMVQTIQEQMSQEQSFWTNTGSSWHRHRLYSDMCLCFRRMFDDILRWLAVEQTLAIIDSDFEDEFIDSDEEQDYEGEFYEYQRGYYSIGQYQSSQMPGLFRQTANKCKDNSVESNDERQDPVMISQIYLLLTVIQSYLMEICQTVQRKRRFRVDKNDEMEDCSC